MAIILILHTFHLIHFACKFCLPSPLSPLSPLASSHPPSLLVNVNEGIPHGPKQEKGQHVIRHVCQQKGIPFSREVRGDVPRQIHLEQQAQGRKQVEEEEDQRALACD